MRGLHGWLLVSPHSRVHGWWISLIKGPVMRSAFPCHDVIMEILLTWEVCRALDGHDVVFSVGVESGLANMWVFIEYTIAKLGPLTDHHLHNGNTNVNDSTTDNDDNDADNNDNNNN